MFPRRCLSSSTRVARKLLHVEKLFDDRFEALFFFFLLLRSKHIYLKTEKNEEKNVADDSVGSCSQSRLKGGSPESLLSVVTRVSVVSIILKVISPKHGRWKNEIAIFFFFVYMKPGFIFNSDSHRLYLCSIRDSYFVLKLRFDRFFTKRIDVQFDLYTIQKSYIYMYTQNRI